MEIDYNSLLILPTYLTFIRQVVIIYLKIEGKYLSIPTEQPEGVGLESRTVNARSHASGSMVRSNEE